MIALIRIELDENHLAKETNEIYDRLQGYNSVLMPLPEKLPPNELGNMSLYKSGWNACLKEITGENE